MGDESSFSPLLTDVYGLFGLAHSPSEGPPPLPELDKPSTGELQLLMSLDPPMRNLAVRFLVAARQAGHQIQLMPAGVGHLGHRLDKAVEHMDETAMHQMGMMAQQAKKAAIQDLEAAGKDVSDATRRLLRIIRVAYFNPATKQIFKKEEVHGDRWHELALIAQRVGLKAGFFSTHKDVAHFEHPVKHAAKKKEEAPAVPSEHQTDTAKIREMVVPLIKQFEGCYKRLGGDKVAAYPDPGTGGDPWTIGWGSTGPDIQKGTVWTVSQCEQRLGRDVEKFMSKVLGYMTVPLVTECYAALVSFAYNAGSGAFRKSTLLKKLNARDYQGAADQFGQWTRGGGKVLPGLVKRRKAERDLFLKGVALLHGGKVPEKPAAPAPSPIGNVDAAVAKLHLRGKALEGAQALIKKYPFLEFTSGRRDLSHQLHAMASNVVQDRKFIVNTYKKSEVSEALQAWVDTHPDAKSVEAINKGFKEVAAKFNDNQIARLSKHLSGDAFDVQPREDLSNAREIKNFIRGLPGCERFLEKESGLTRWHAQFFTT